MIQSINHCPGCLASFSLGAERRKKKCCNPQCKGEWTRQCYHCHHPSYWPDPLYVVTAKNSNGKRIFRSYIRSGDEGGGVEQAVRTFTARMASTLLVKHGAKWRIEVRVGVPGSPSDFGPVIAIYTHYAKGATIYHEPVEIEMTEPTEKPDTREPPEKEPAETPPKPGRITRAEALENLRAYLSQQVEYEAINIIEGVINELATHSGEHRVQVSIGSVPLDYAYNDMLQQAQGLQLGKLTPPAWLGRFKDLVAEIRTEHDLDEDTREKPEPVDQCWPGTVLPK